MPPDIMSGELTLITMTVDLPLYASRFGRYYYFRLLSHPQLTVVLNVCRIYIYIYANELNLISVQQSLLCCAHFISKLVLNTVLTTVKPDQY